MSWKFWQKDRSIVERLESTVEEQFTQIEALQKQLSKLQAEQAQFESIQDSLVLQNRWSAIDRAMCIIEFDLQGHILYANENFLQVVGFEPEELIGHHHSKLVGEVYKKSTEYQQFWKTLAEGDFIAERVPRVNKEGQTVWLEASYNPVFDEQGRVHKYIKFATNITAAVEREFDARGKLDAINKSMSVIEFGFDGCILSANENFLNMMGYDVEHVVGQHHRMFVDQGYSSSLSYQDFWSVLAKGQFVSGTFKRLNAKGETVWLEATYNPVYDAEGRLKKVVKFATNIEASEQTQNFIRSLDLSTEIVRRLNEGEYDFDITQAVSSLSDSMYSSRTMDLMLALHTLARNLNKK